MLNRSLKPHTFTPQRRGVAGSLTCGQVSPSTQQGVDKDRKERSVESKHWGH